jgi:hypothetical protein
VLSPLEPPDLFDRVEVRATLDSTDGTHLSCNGLPRSPALAGVPALAPFNATLAVTYDLQELLWHKPLYFYATPTLSVLEPSRATVSQSELLVSIQGTDIEDGGSAAVCKLESVNDPTKKYLASRITFKSREEVECVWTIV